MQDENCDGWLIYDFRRSNPIGCSFLNIAKDELLSRRFFVWIGKDGSIQKIVHRIENPLKHIPGIETFYSSWAELQGSLQILLAGKKSIAMEYSPEAAIPEISRVDGGTIDFIRKCGVEVISSGALLQEFAGIWNSEKLDSHFYAIHVLENAFQACWAYIRENLGRINEYDVQQFALKQYSGCVTDCLPICAVNKNSANPHYFPMKNSASLIKNGDIIMLDLGCKQDKAHAVYGDLTKMAIAGAAPKQEHLEIFAVVKSARDAALSFIEEKWGKGEIIRGFEVDDCCRTVIRKAGYGDFFTHRTGHSIDEMEHGPGTHIDNLETHDWRKLKPNTCFSIEPGIYLPSAFGVRLECDVVLFPDGKMQVTGGLQEKFITLF